MKLIDANVVIYALGDPHPYKTVCQRVFSRVLAGEVEATIDTELLQEVVHYYHRRGRLEFGLSVFDRLLTLFPDPFPVTRDTSLLMRDILENHPQLQARDALHAAVVLQRGLEGVISADRGFDAISAIRRLDPTQL